MKKILTDKIKKVKECNGYTYDKLICMYNERYGVKLTPKQISNILKRDGENVSISTLEKLLWVMNISIGIVFEEITSGTQELIVFNKN